MNRVKVAMIVVALLLIALTAIQLGYVHSLTGAATGGSGTVGLCINHAPTFYNLTNYTIPHNTAFNYTVFANDSDNHGISFTDNTSLFVIGNTTGKINFIPNITNVGNHSILLILQDYNSSCIISVEDLFTLSINNSIPYLSQNIPNQTWEEDVTLTGLNLTSYFSDYENDTLNFSATYGDNVTITISNFTVTFVPDTDFYGISWVIFTANDSLGTATSNNVTLNITQVPNVCGDAVCNAEESCSICAADCGACPATPSTPSNDGSGGGGGGGGGSGFRVNMTRANATNDTTQTCASTSKCSGWAPASCLFEDQQRSCIEVQGDCTTLTTVNTRACNCIADWQCSPWVPDYCPRSGFQERSCIDRNNCDRDEQLPTQRDCVYDPAREPQGFYGLAALGQEALLKAKRLAKDNMLALGLTTTIVVILTALLRRKKHKLIARHELSTKEHTIDVDTIIEVRYPHRIRIYNRVQCVSNKTKRKYKKELR